MMERITKPGFKFDGDYVASNLESFPIALALDKLQKYEDTGLQPDEIARMVDAMKAGRLKEVPALVGDTVWEIRCNYVHRYNRRRYDNSVVGHAALMKEYPECLYAAERTATKTALKFIGQSVFATEAEAVAAIKEAQKKYGKTD